MKRWEYYKAYSLKYLKTIKIGDVICFENGILRYPDKIVLSIDKTFKYSSYNSYNIDCIWKIITDDNKCFYTIKKCVNDTADLFEIYI